MAHAVCETDVAVLGAGPAALAIAGACARAGLRVLCIAPEPLRPWLPNYCCWQEEIPSRSDYNDCVERVWSSARVDLGADLSLTLPRRYVKLHTRKLQLHLQHVAVTHGVRIRTGRVRSMHHYGDHTLMGLGGSTNVRALLVVDASGAKSCWTRRLSKRTPAYQIAYGQLLCGAAHPFAIHQARLMDYRSPPAAPSVDTADELPSFLYALPIDAEHVFVEETVLATRAPVSFEQLARRLHSRLPALGLASHRCEAVELCRIPLGLPLPRVGQRVVAFGAAGSMVNPVSGYSLMRTLGAAEALAGTIAEKLRQSAPQAAAEAAYALLWPRDRRRMWEYYHYGMELLCRLERDRIQDFFQVFFSLPDDEWLGFMAGTLSPSRFSEVMWRIFSMAAPRLRRHLIAPGFASASGPVVRGLGLRGTQFLS